MPIIRPNKGYLRKYSPLTPLPLTPLRVPMMFPASERVVQSLRPKTSALSTGCGFGMYITEQF